MIAAGLTVIGLSPAASGLPMGHGVPGLVQRATLLGGSSINSVSCPAPGSCAAGGGYMDRSGHFQAFVIRQVRGTWRQPMAVTGPSDLNTGGIAEVESVSCSSAGDCAAGGIYYTRPAQQSSVRPFVIDEVGGRWGKATEIPGITTLTSGQAWVVSVSCASPGDCAVVGGFVDQAGNTRSFVVSQAHGQWGTPIEIPGLAALSPNGPGVVESVSCPAGGDCAAVGVYQDTESTFHPFVVDEIDGTWGTAIEVPGMTALNSQGVGGLSSVSCASPGNCGAVGQEGPELGMVVTEREGTWGRAREVPGLRVLNDQHLSELNAVSCARSGQCAAGGVYKTHPGRRLKGFLASQVRGRWTDARQVPGLVALNTGGESEVLAISCAAPGDCAAGGYYAIAGLHFQAFVVSQARGRWVKAIEVPGIGALNTGRNGQVNAVSCSAPGNCVAGGYYAGSGFHQHAFLVAETGGRWHGARPVF